MAEGPSARYKKVDYWDSRYGSEVSYDWLLKYEAIRPFLREKLKVEDRILILGCGNSELSEDLFKDGFENITNVDYSSVVISSMAKKNDVTARMKWVVMDVTCMDFEPESFDVVLEKATLDGLLVDEKDPWQLSDDAERTMGAVMQSVSKILKPGGKFLSISFGQPHFRSKIFARQEYGWSLDIQTIGEAFHYYFYSMQKGGALDPKYLVTHTGPVFTPSSSADGTSEENDFLSLIGM